ncbi:P-loop containing nucleoside triphosphate hydrolase protein [Amylocystis lapponica]|nr:P-loop containing nucleoside triphosphate hydrolase protein [Amylocystis lapponica]
MEAFQLLSRGGVRFDKTRFKSDVQLFHQGKSKTDKGNTVSHVADGEIPPELDFFKYAQGGSAKRKDREGGNDASGSRMKKPRTEAEEGTSEHSEAEDDPPVPRHRVTAKGSEVPEHADTFQALKERYDVSSHLLANLSQIGYKQPTGIQSHGIPILLESRDLAAISPTGTGKTLSYLLPIMSLLGAPISSTRTDVGAGVRAIVLAPTRELAHQIHNECLKLAQGRKWRIVLFSKATASTLADRTARDKVGAHHHQHASASGFALQGGNLELHNVRHVVLDEADRMLDSEFLSQVQEVVASCTHPDVQKAVFSATLPAGAEKIALSMLRDPIRVVVGLKDTPLPLIAQSLTYVADDASKLPTLLQHLAQPYNPPLVLSGIPNVDCLHAGLSKKEREDAVARMRRGDSWVFISTEVMARGMDFKGVREVVNYDFPQSVQSYVHRIGRTGRAGREGKAVTYFTDEDAPFLKTIANVLLQSGSSVPEWILKLPKPSKMKRREMGKVKRAEAVTNAHKVGRNDAIKKRDMVAGSKRRKAKAEHAQKVSGESASDSGDDER